jgi:cell division protein FtsN
VKKQASSGASNILILIIGLIVVAVLALGLLWATQFKKNSTPVAQAPAAQRIKIAPTAPQASPPQTPAEPSLSQAPEAPAPVISSPQETPSQEPAEEQPVEPPLAATTDAPAPQDETPAAAALKDTPEPADSTSAQEEVRMVQPQEDTSTEPAGDTPVESAAAQPATDSQAATVHYNLQVGAFREKANAMAAMAKLSKSGYDPFIFEITDSGQRIWYTVRIGRYNSRAEAALSLDRLNKEENLSAVIAKAGRP